MTEPSRHGLTSTRLTLNWYRWGRAEAPPLILLHGGRDHGRSWDDMAVRFADRWQVVAPDLRGHGLSQWSDGGGYALDDFVYDLHRLADHLGVSAERPATIVGHSYGGAIAVRWTALFPDRVRRLVAIEGLGSSPDQAAAAAKRPVHEPLIEWIARRGRREHRDLPVYPTIEAAAARMQQANPRFPLDLARRLTEQGVRAVPGGVTFAHDPLILAWSPGDTPLAMRRALWGRITCPVLLLYGKESWASNPAEDGRAAAFADARVVAFDDAGHWVQHDRFDAVAAEIAGFIQ